jgi:hypothetical protein
LGGKTQTAKMPPSLADCTSVLFGFAPEEETDDRNGFFQSVQE